MVKFALVAPLISLAACAVADVSSDVRCREIAFSRSAENRNIEAFKSFLDIDARFVGSSALRGPDQISAAWEVFFTEDGPAIKWRPKFVEVLEDGTLALTRGPYRMIDKDADDNLMEVWGTFNSVWRKNADEEWRVVFDAGSPAPGPPDVETQALLDNEDTC